MDSSPLARLPAELRVLVYNDLPDSDDRTITIRPFSGGECNRWLGRRTWRAGVAPLTQSPAISKVCKQLRGETLPIFYSTNTFCFEALNREPDECRCADTHESDCSCISSLVTEWFQHIGPKYAQRLPRVQLKIDYAPMSGFPCPCPAISNGEDGEVIYDFAHCLCDTNAECEVSICFNYSDGRDLGDPIVMNLSITDYVTAYQQLEEHVKGEAKYIHDVGPQWYEMDSLIRELYSSRERLELLIDIFGNRNALGEAGEEGRCDEKEGEV